MATRLPGTDVVVVGVGAVGGVAVLPLTQAGLNVVGLKRRGLSDEVIGHLKKAYKILSLSKLKLSDAMAKIREEVPSSPEVDYFVQFIENAKRGICR